MTRTAEVGEVIGALWMQWGCGVNAAVPTDTGFAPNPPRWAIASVAQCFGLKTLATAGFGCYE
jgi:hypothetical protein